MKKFLLKLSVFLLYAFILQVVFPVVVDPFHVFRPERIMTNTQITPNMNYVKMTYILHHPDIFDSFIFGSSRAGVIHPQKMPGKTYNMWYPGGIPQENAANIKTFFQNNIRPSKIYLSVDSLSYTVSLKDRIMQPGRCSYEYLRDNPGHFYSLYLNPMDTLRSLWIMMSSPEQNTNEMFFRFGYWLEYNDKMNYVWKDDSDMTPTEYRQLTGSQMNIEQTLASIKEMADMCRENGTELIIFTNPMHRLTYLASLEKRYLDFLEGLAEISDFWNFSSLNSITLNNANYREHSHYYPEVGDIMIDIMCNGKSYPQLQRQGFGVKVSSENARDFISMLRRQYQDYTE